MPNNEEILEKINSIDEAVDYAVKAITKPDLGSSQLTAEQADNFIRQVQESTPMLERARRIEMNESDKRNIDRTGFSGRILHDPDQAEGDRTEQPDFHTNQLDAVMVDGIAGIEDDALQDNIESENFEETLTSMMGEQAGNDIEELGVKGDTSASGDPFLNNLTDGWAVKAGNSVDATASGDVDESDAESVLQAGFDAVPRKYMKDRRNWYAFCSYDIEDAYRDILKSRGTGLGDEAQTNANMLKYKGFNVLAVGSMPSDQLIFTNPDNLVYGIRRDMTIEPDRQPKEHKTDFVITLRLDYNYEDENGACHVENASV